MRAGCTSGIANNASGQTAPAQTTSLTDAQFASGWHIPSSLELDTLRNARSTTIGWTTGQDGEWYTSSQIAAGSNGRSEWFNSGVYSDAKTNELASLRVSAFNSTS
jgi:hypothetical protein